MSTSNDQEKNVGLGICTHRIQHRSPGMAMPEGHSFKPYVEERKVRVLAIAEGYAMVRRKGAMPYVAPMEELF